STTSTSRPPTLPPPTHSSSPARSAKSSSISRVAHIQASMILRVSHAIPTQAGQDAWRAFAKTQQSSDRIAGCVSQPAHAALAAPFAAALQPDAFDILPAEVIDAIGQHDAGWADPDLAALECIAESQPQSFISCPAEDTVRVWRKSIREAETRSPLA